MERGVHWCLRNPPTQLDPPLVRWCPLMWALNQRSKRLEVVGARKNGRARGRHAKEEGAPSPLARLPLVRPFFLAPATQASKLYGFLCLSLWYDFLLFILLIKERFTSFVPRISPSSLLHLPRTKSSCGVSLPRGGGRDSHVKMKGILVVSLWDRNCRALFH